MTFCEHFMINLWVSALAAKGSLSFPIRTRLYTELTRFWTDILQGFQNFLSVCSTGKDLKSLPWRCSLSLSWALHRCRMPWLAENTVTSNVMGPTKKLTKAGSREPWQKPEKIVCLLSSILQLLTLRRGPVLDPYGCLFSPDIAVLGNKEGGCRSKRDGFVSM